MSSKPTSFNRDIYLTAVMATFNGKWTRTRGICGYLVRAWHFPVARTGRHHHGLRGQELVPHPRPVRESSYDTLSICLFQTLLMDLSEHPALVSSSWSRSQGTRARLQQWVFEPALVRRFSLLIARVRLWKAQGWNKCWSRTLTSLFCLLKKQIYSISLVAVGNRTVREVPPCSLCCRAAKPRRGRRGER